MSRSARYGLGGGGGGGAQSRRPFERMSDSLMQEERLNASPSSSAPSSSSATMGRTTRIRDGVGTIDEDDDVDGGGGMFDTVVLSNGDVGASGGRDDDATGKTTHVLSKSRLLASTLAFSQGIFAIATTFVLLGPNVRTGWAHTYGAAMSLACAFEGLTHVAARAVNRLTTSLDVFSTIVCVASYVGVAGLATNTEDDAHGVPVDAIETATCLFGLAWGLMTARLAASFVEREARDECTFELKFVSTNGGV